MKGNMRPVHFNFQNVWFGDGSDRLSDILLGVPRLKGSQNESNEMIMRILWLHGDTELVQYVLLAPCTHLYYF